MKSITTLFLRHERTGALETITLGAVASPLHPELFAPMAEFLQQAARRIRCDGWSILHQQTIDTDSPASRQPSAEGSDAT